MNYNSESLSFFMGIVIGWGGGGGGGPRFFQPLLCIVPGLMSVQTPISQ